MKWLSIIMSFYIMALSIMPCSDLGDSFSYTKDTSISLKKTTHNEGNHQDVCSPFCTCNCCKTLVNFSFETIKVKYKFFDKVVSNKSFPSYSVSFLSNYYVNIWQPPKV